MTIRFVEARTFGPLKIGSKLSQDEVPEGILMSEDFPHVNIFDFTHQVSAFVRDKDTIVLIGSDEEVCNKCLPSILSGKEINRNPWLAKRVRWTEE